VLAPTDKLNQQWQQTDLVPAPPANRPQAAWHRAGRTWRPPGAAAPLLPASPPHRVTGTAGTRRVDFTRLL